MIDIRPEKYFWTVNNNNLIWTVNNNNNNINPKKKLYDILKVKSYKIYHDRKFELMVYLGGFFF